MFAMGAALRDGCPIQPITVFQAPMIALFRTTLITQLIGSLKKLATARHAAPIPAATSPALVWNQLPNSLKWPCMVVSRPEKNVEMPFHNPFHQPLILVPQTPAAVSNSCPKVAQLPLIMVS